MRKSLAFVASATLAAVPTVARADKPTAEALCGVITDGKVETVVPTPDKRKLDKVIACAIHVKTGAAEAASISVLVDGKEGASSFDVLPKGEDHEATLSPGSDYPTCKDFVIVARLYKDKQPVWEKKMPVVQACPPGAAATKPTPPASKPAPPAPKPTPAEDTDGTWADGELDRLPKDAAEALQNWTYIYLARDHQFPETWPKAGVKVRGKVYSWSKLPMPPPPNDDYDHALGILPLARCADEEHQTGCHFGRWHANVKSKTAIEIYCGNDSGYGKFTTVVFAKQGKSWVWTSMGTYDTGEP